MLAKLLGRMELDFKSKDGNTIKGTNLYIAFKSNNVEGLKADKVFVKPEIQMPNVNVGDELDLSFDMNGKIDKVSIVKVK